MPAWPAALRAAGYRTGLIGKWHLGYQSRFHPVMFGFEYFAGFPGGGSGPIDPILEVEGATRQLRGSTPDIFTDFALDFIRRRRNEPFLLSIHYREPHPSNAPDLTGSARTWRPLPAEDWRRFRDLDPKIPNPGYPRLDIPEVKRMMREYLASVACLDRNVGRVLALLDDAGLTHDTIVVFTSDNGMNMGHHGIWHKGNGRWILTDNRGERPNLYDESLRVPAVIRWPQRLRAGMAIRETISNLDWFPTLLELAGTPVPMRLCAGICGGGRMRWDSVEGTVRVRLVGCQPTTSSPRS